MGITDKFIKMLGATEEETNAIIDKMSEKMAKELLKTMMKAIKKHRTNIEDL